MRNKIIILLALFLAISFFVYGRENKSEKKIRLTKKNFNEYFEFVILSDSRRNNFIDPNSKTHRVGRVYYGWQLKKELIELTDNYPYISFETPVILTVQGHGIQTFRIEFDDEDPEVFTVFEQVGIVEDFTQSMNFRLYDDPKTGEKHWGFFTAALSFAYDNGPVFYADLPEPDQLTLVTVNGILKLHH